MDGADLHLKPCQQRLQSATRTILQDRGELAKGPNGKPDRVEQQHRDDEDRRRRMTTRKTLHILLYVEHDTVVAARRGNAIDTGERAL